MSAASAPPQVIEHIVLFKVKDDAEPSKVEAMVSGLNGLVSLDQVLHLTAGPVLRTTGSSLFSFTHMLHYRYSSKDDLAAYSAHPEHLRVVRENGPVCEDIMAVDWIVEGFSGPAAPPPGSAVKVTLLKLKENLRENVKDEVIGVIQGIKEESGAVEQLTCGENFSPARAKGFSIGSLAVFKGVAEMEAAASSKELVESRKEKVRDFLDSAIVVDYLVPGSSIL